MRYQVPRKARGLECSHHHGRGNWSIRFEPQNAEALCTGCHFLEGGTQIRLDADVSKAEQWALMEKKMILFWAKPTGNQKAKEV